MAESNNYCRICGPTSFDLFLIKNNHHLNQCRECGLIQVTDDLTNLNLKGIYGQEFFEKTYDWLEKDFKGEKKEYKKFQYRMQEIETLYPPKGNILDIGCSYGYFLDVARSRGWAPMGIEIGEYAAKFAQTRLALKVYNSDFMLSEIPFDYFDVVTLWNVLEHLDDPIAVFRKINMSLKRRGLVVFTTGDTGSYIRKLQGTRWRAFIPPIHLANYNVKSIRRLLEKTGFSLMVRSVALPYEFILKKLRMINILKKINFSDKMMIFALKEKSL